MRIDKSEILSLFKGMPLNDEEKQYLYFHAERLAFTTSLVQTIVEKGNVKKLLDVGPHLLTYCLSQKLDPQPDIFTLGFANHRLFPERFAKKHFEIDLNYWQSTEISSKDANFDFIIFSETIEHLYTSPKKVFLFLSGLLNNKPGSGMLIQTPNATTLYKRIFMLLGINPFELIREERSNPGHFREYTLNELKQYAKDAGFEITVQKYCTYWSGNNVLKRIIDIYPPFREGITLLLTKK
jgi:hypothetical protein